MGDTAEQQPNLTARFTQFLTNMPSRNSNNCYSMHELPMPEASITEDGPRLPNDCSMHELPMPTVSTLYDGDNSRPLQYVFSRTPLKVARGVKQYLYDDNDVEFLDCINSTAHIGHCHPQVVSAGHLQMSKLATAQGFVSDVLSKYTKELVETLPDPLSVCYICNSGTEANDLALRLANQYTEGEDILAAEGSYHGNSSKLIDTSHKMHAKVPGYKQPDWVHFVRLPDTYRIETDEDWEKYSREFDAKVESIVKSGRRLSAFIFEPFFAIAGVYKPPTSVVQAMVRSVRSRGGLIIADEVQTGLGRTGEMWGFLNYQIVPDIVTIGKPLGNGYPMGAVICSMEISTKLGAYFSTFGGNPVSCSIGLAVLDVVRNEKLMSSARMVGKYLKAELLKLKQSHELLGDVRGSGLIFSLEIVHNSGTKLPAPKQATEMMYGLRLKNILIAITGDQKNILYFTPPLCFNIENSRRFVKAIDEVLTSLEKNVINQSVIVARQSLENIPRDRLKRGIIGSEVEVEAKRTRLISEDGDGYEDMD